MPAPFRISMSARVSTGWYVDLALMALAQQYGDSSGRKVRTS
jgi:hypothetical protein